MAKCNMLNVMVQLEEGLALINNSYCSHFSVFSLSAFLYLRKVSSKVVGVYDETFSSFKVSVRECISYDHSNAV